jgi:hypothetical protein
VRRQPRIPGTTKPARVLYFLPAIPDDAPTELKNGLAVRNACAVDGRCPECGAVGEVRGFGAMAYRCTFTREDGCAALLEELVS